MNNCCENIQYYNCSLTLAAGGEVCLKNFSTFPKNLWVKENTIENFNHNKHKSGFAKKNN